jgi:hypothetical protein
MDSNMNWIGAFHVSQRQGDMIQSGGIFVEDSDAEYALSSRQSSIRRNLKFLGQVNRSIRNSHRFRHTSPSHEPILAFCAS